MRNFLRKNLDVEARGSGAELFHAAVLSIVIYVVALAEGDGVLVTGALAFWGVFYAFYAPYLVRGVRLGGPPGDPWRAAAYVAYGALPFGLYIPFWSELTARPQSIAAYPLIMLWSATALTMAGLERPLRGSRRRQSLFLGLAGGIYAFAAGPIYLGLLVGVLTGWWTPPDRRYGAMLPAFLIGMPFAALSAYAAIELLGRANRIDQAVEPAP